MSRYKPPQRRGSTYITPEGEQGLRSELHQLWKVERPQVTNAVHEAAKNGDRSENGDYIYGKRRLREIDSRVRFLNKRLDELKVIDQTPADTSRIFFGAWVQLEDAEGQEQCWRIVGPDEFDLPRGNVEFVVHDQNFLRCDFVKAGQCRDRAARKIHEGLRFEQPHRLRVDHGACHLTMKRPVRHQICPE